MLKPSELAAWFGAITGATALFWDIYKWKIAGPKLKAAATAGMVTMFEHYSNSKYVMIRVRNVGTNATTLTTLGLVTYESLPARLRRRAAKAFIVPAQSPERTLPFKLGVGEEWTGVIREDQRLKDLISSGKLWCQVYHSWSKRPISCHIDIEQDHKPDSTSISKL